MNIKIPNNWLKEYLKTKADAQSFADALSLSSVSVERIEKFKNESVYDIEVTTNRADLMSITGIAREAATILPEHDIDASYKEVKLEKITTPQEKIDLKITSDAKITNRVCAVALEVKVNESPQEVKDRLEATGIRSLNNVIDVTNYIMREMGHPAHVFDYDKLEEATLTISQSQKGDTITTLDGKEHTLNDGDIVARDGTGKIVDLLGIMGLKNSVVDEETKKIVLFINNNNPQIIRQTSMKLGIRTEAAILNEKNLDPELAYQTLQRGVELYKKLANAKVVSDVIDIYPNKAKQNKVTTSVDNIRKIIGVDISNEKITSVLKRLGFAVKITHDTIETTVPTWREKDVTIAEDIIEEVARVYGYHKIPNALPPLEEKIQPTHNTFYWENRIKNALKYWGFTETYTYSMVGENMLETAPSNAVTVQNPLTQDHVYMRTKIVPSLLQVIHDNTNRSEIKVFEMANIYLKRDGTSLPEEKLTLAALWKKENINFLELKGMVEQLTRDLGIQKLSYKARKEGGIGSDIYIEGDKLGDIEILEENIADFELDVAVLLKHATTHKKYTPPPKYPPVIEDVTVTTDAEYAKIISTIKEASDLVKNVELIDVYENNKTFRITYLDPNKNLSSKDVEADREKIQKALHKKLQAEIKE